MQQTASINRQTESFNKQPSSFDKATSFSNELTEHLNSEQFIHLTHSDEVHDWLEGTYDFNEFNSGIHVHGGVLTPKKNMDCSRMVDSYVNFIVLLEGQLRFSINNHLYEIPAKGGRIIMVSIAQESLFTRHLIQGERCVKVAVKGIEKWLRQYYKKTVCPAVFDDTVRIWTLTPEIRELCLFFLKQHENSLYQQLHQEANALHLLAELWRTFEQHSDAQTHNVLPNPTHAFTQQLNAIFQPSWHISDLAKALNISERTLQRRVQEHFGLTIHAWLRHKKMKYALHALKHSTLSIGEISYECGYKHVSNFTQAFKQYFDCTPAQVKE
ncbi:helix-turn-helix transcriptional regulator [Pelistega europaea]|uniref:Helix-turn-helix transcriptional regulator n=1 Tax=Pelistega europaea TaxID=106147 RepID=A0A7Y4P5P6_9BURK|nr:helix-turn-helix transcriptional regulator [Pelistega europaea]NOL49079.1 helix-turn-helix transcriptional regulator [Pelistega europaea]